MFVYLLSWSGPCSLDMPVASGRRMWRMVWETMCIMPRVRWGYKISWSGIFLGTCWVSFWTAGRSHFAVGSGPVVSGYQIHRSMAPGLATWFRRPETWSIFEIAISGNLKAISVLHFCWWNSCRCYTMCTIYFDAIQTWSPKSEDLSQVKFLAQPAGQALKIIKGSLIQAPSIPHPFTLKKNSLWLVCAIFSPSNNQQYSWFIIIIIYCWYYLLLEYNHL